MIKIPQFATTPALQTLGRQALSSCAGTISEALINNLEHWRESGPDVERDSRGQAQRLILRNQASHEKRLELSHLTLSSLPSSLGLMKHLEQFDVINVGLHSLPPEIGSLHKLKCLHLAGNDLTELPAELRNLKKLKRLFLNANKLAELPDWLGDLEMLQMLHVPHNQLTELPESLRRLMQLTDFDAHDNRIAELPLWLREMNLRYLDVASNPIHNFAAFAAAERCPEVLVDSLPLPRSVRLAIAESRKRSSPEASSLGEVAATL